MNITLKPPRTLCVGCWENITFCVGLRTNIDLRPRDVIRVLSEYCTNIRYKEGHCVAIRESCLNEQPTDQEIILDALFCFLDSFPLSVLFTTLDRQGLSKLSDALCVNHTFGQLIPVQYGQFHDSGRLQQFYYTLKNFFDKNVITVENEFLTDLFDRKVAKFKNMNEIGKALNANKIALITWLRIQQCKRDTRRIRSVLDSCLEIWPIGVDKTLVNAIYHSKMAVADAMDGNEHSAIHHIHAAMCDILFINDPIKVLLYHDRRYVYQLLGKRDSELNNATFPALAILDSYNEEANHSEYLIQMKRMFLLYSSQHHLGIENDLKINEDVIPDSDHMTAARGTLHCFEESKSNGTEVEPRRLMIYHFCKGRYLERIDPEMAMFNLQHALSYAQQGAKFGKEKHNIELFLRKCETDTRSVTLYRRTPLMP